MDEQSVIKESNNWVRCQSKSRPGQYYMFNSKSRETHWCTESKGKTQQNNLGKRKMQTPAQDRLKCLQKNLEKTKHKDGSLAKAKDGLKNKRLDFSLELRTVKPLSANEETPTLNSSKITEKISLSKRIAERNISQSNIEKVSPVATENQNNMLQSEKNMFRIPKKPISLLDNTSKKKAPKRKQNDTLNPTPTCSSGPKKQHLNQSTSDSSDFSAKKVRTSYESETSQRKTYTDDENMVRCDINDNIGHSKDQKSTLMSAIKDFCTSFFKKVHTKKENKLEDKTKNSNLSNNSKPSFKSKKPAAKSSEQKNHIRQRSMSEYNAYTTLSSSSPKGSANERLLRLRRSLLDQQTSLNRTQHISSPTFSSLVSIPSDSSASSLSKSHLESEAMDWQSIYEDSPLNNNTMSSSISNVSSLNVSTRSEHWDAVNENLLRLAADKKQHEKHWKNDYYYFVVDTNVFLENVTFVNELTTMQLCDTTGSLIYIPYCVLQELDKLKIRSPSESIKTRSIRAIHFINKAFESNTHHIQAQSSADENKHLIKVTSADDSILNCCLQVKEHIENVLLLTEDINLRNKAICSDILVSTKSDLISKHESQL